MASYSVGRCWSLCNVGWPSLQCLSGTKHSRQNLSDISSNERIEFFLKLLSVVSAAIYFLKDQWWSSIVYFLCRHSLTSSGTMQREYRLFNQESRCVFSQSSMLLFCNSKNVSLLLYALGSAGCLPPPRSWRRVPAAALPLLPRCWSSAQVSFLSSGGGSDGLRHKSPAPVLQQGRRSVGERVVIAPQRKGPGHFPESMQ